MQNSRYKSNIFKIRDINVFGSYSFVELPGNIFLDKNLKKIFIDFIRDHKSILWLQKNYIQ